MKKLISNKFVSMVLSVFALISCLGFTQKEFSIDNFDTYEKEYVAKEIDGCFNVSAKTYMPYTAITNINSKQYKFIKEKMTVDETTGMLYDEDGFLGAALASKFGNIGERYYFTLEDGKVLPIVKIDEKSDNSTNGCTAFDGHLIEFVIDTNIASEYFGTGATGLVKSGNFNNDDRFKGIIVKFEKVTDEEVNSNDIMFVNKMVDYYDKTGDVDVDYNLYGGY